MTFEQMALAIIVAEETLQRQAWISVLNQHPVVVADAQMILGTLAA